ncbi:DUF4148 domain-containing protein [Burkholderia cepacia]|uniref:Exported protein n=1 Tax=Burkholderia cepacia GG4 TaxID=1009846 RepID=A0A9W3P981_BURCE|nr:DUF4148 domain-containing protein [Burkholderia cepacia]AFQ48145.1 exported protein [Burkholderia cepacia GG4]
MKTALSVLVLAAALAAPAVSFAQSAATPVTRAEVVAQLQQLEQAGYKPLKSQYPDDLRAAEARIEQGSGIGADAGASSASGRPALTEPVARTAGRGR